MQATYNQFSARDLLAEPVRASEWKRSGRFFAIAIALHVAVLAYPIAKHISEPQFSVPLTASLVMRGVQSAQRAMAPQPKAEPVPHQTVPVRKQELVKPTPVITTTASAPVTAAPAPVATAPVASPVPAAASAASQGASGGSAKMGVSSGEGEGVKVVGPKYNAAYLHNPSPIYPMLSRRLGEEGSITLRVHVSAEGKPTQVSVLKSSGFDRLDDSALKTVQRWRFVPASRGGDAIEADVTVPIDFKLLDA